jgi:uncharacterized membrane protein YoaK (UPF0700 family)
MSPQDRRLGAALSSIAGYVDAVGFLMTGGFFVSFMSGNTTRLAIGLAEAGRQAALAGGLIFAFVLGAVIGALLGRAAGPRRRLATLGLVTVLLALGAVLAAAGMHLAATLAVALAMGAVNTVLADDGEVRVGLTYMTGNLVKLGLAIAGALAGERTTRWPQHLALWTGLLAGAALGALAFAALDAAALWPAVAVMAALTATARVKP